MISLKVCDRPAEVRLRRVCEDVARDDDGNIDSESNILYVSVESESGHFMSHPLTLDELVGVLNPEIIRAIAEEVES